MPDNDVGQAPSLASPPRTYASTGGKAGLGAGAIAGAASALLHKGRRNTKGIAIGTLGTAALWGTAGLLGGSIVGKTASESDSIHEVIATALQLSTVLDK